MREQVYQVYLDFLETAENKRRWNILNDVPWDKLDIGKATDEVGDRIEIFCIEELYVPNYDKWIARVTDLLAGATACALARAGLAATDIDHICFTTVTGIASPSVDAKLVNRMSMRSDIKRTPIFGLRCVGGAAGIARVFRIRRLFSQVVDCRRMINSSSSASKTQTQHIVPPIRLRTSCV